MERKEAIEVVKKNYPHVNVSGSQFETALRTLIPELKESEDEKIKQLLLRFVKYDMSDNYSDDFTPADCVAWLEKQVKCEIDYPQNHQDSNCPNGCIVLEDFNGGEGFYKVHLDYLNKKQVEEIEEMIRVWNKELKTSNENIKDCIGMCLTDVDEQRFKDYNTNLKDCLAWLEKQCEQKPANWLQELEDKLANATPQQLAEWKEKYFKEEPAEWSEEDENILNTIINHFEIDLECTENDDIIRWLKSLRPQNRWKPSIAQLNALSIVSKGNAPDDIEAIVSLYQDLKKLREE